MEVYKLEDMIKGWFVGNFEPTLYRTNDVEVAVKRYRAGEIDVWHYHKVATEITVIVDGEVLMNGDRYMAGDIVKIAPGEGTDFTVIKDTTTVVVKLPGANNDKYLADKQC